MNLPMLRGRDLKPPTRRDSVRPVAAPGIAQPQRAPQQNGETEIKKGQDRKKALRFPVGLSSKAFYRRFYPDTTAAEWNDWRWQMRARIRTLSELERIFTLSDDERVAVAAHTGPLPVGITPYYASLMGLDDPNEPLRRTHIMTGSEAVRMPGEDEDPLGEDHDTVAPGIVHRYPDRVLFLTTGTCSTYCRYCTRARAVGNPGGEYQLSVKQWDQALAYLEAHHEVRDVLLSGGDPLTLSDEKLDYLLGRLRGIKHIEFVRIGSKIPVVLPQRITKDFMKVLKRHKPWMSIHFTHPSEITGEVAESTARIADSGVPMGSQTVLLKGINDDPAVMTRLMHELLKNRVKPYYLYQCDPIKGSGHFRTTVDAGIAIINALRGHTTGYATPMFVVDAPGGGGKILVGPDYVVGHDKNDLLLKNFEGKVYRYPDPGGTLGRGKARLAAV